MKTFWILVLALAMSGCAVTHGYAVLADDKASQAADIALQDLEVGLCRYISVGAWTRRYGSDPQKADAWRRLCAENFTQIPSR